jgi:riboflavin synthase
MFTGLIEDVGKIGALRLNDGAAVLTVKTRLAVRSMPLGASVAVNGACLTVVKKLTGAFTVDVSPETLACTNLAQLAVGSLVNLEQPMRLQERLGGHLVTGHVDGVGRVASIRTLGEFTIFNFRVPPALAGLLVSKGSVAVDGISLTVNDCRRDGFSVAIIPFTLRHTNLQGRRVGDKVNIETDLIGKYVHSFLAKR